MILKKKKYISIYINTLNFSTSPILFAKKKPDLTIETKTSTGNDGLDAEKT